MSGMPGMGAELDPLTWSTFFTTWRLEAGWLEASILLLSLYLLGHRRAVRRGDSTVRPWRVVSWITGVVLMYVSVASAIGAYAMSVFWMHMVLHLMMIMVVPALLVLGHPLTVLLEAFEGPARDRVQRALHSWPVTVLSHPAVGLLVYSVTIIGTHLTGFMDYMAEHQWAMTAELVLYVAAGYLFLLPLLGEEPTRPSPSYLSRLGVFVVGMVPDTIVGIVLLQTNQQPFPRMVAMHPDWAPDGLRDVNTAGALMWAAGDGLMMILAMGLMITVITTPAKRARMTGSWLEGVRRSTLMEHAGEGSEGITDADSDEALDAYNRMLARLREHE
ncbi:MAG: cytochrome c oxidase assembly protein [Nocardioides sp.]